ncbi:hypothetical protein C8Q76DRAFT_738087 [Earliella scabrosa]|nr:hypothetical protein C8Q76DRAFT_738087 [Earliella scabrosa]
MIGRDLSYSSLSGPSHHARPSACLGFCSNSSTLVARSSADTLFRTILIQRLPCLPAMHHLARRPT